MNTNKIVSLLLPFLLVTYCAQSQNKGLVYEDASGFISTPVYTDATLTGGGTSSSPLSVVSAGGTTPYTISPSQLSSDQDNYNPTGVGRASYILLSSDSGMRAITGITDSTAGVLEKVIINTGSDYLLYFPMEHPDSDAAHRFTGYVGDFILYPGASVRVLYDVAVSRWRLLQAPDILSAKGPKYSISAGSVTTGDHELLALTNISTGSPGAVAAQTSLPASYQLSTSSGATSGSILSFSKSVNTYSAYGSAHITIESLLTLPTLSDGTETYTSEVQITNQPTSTTLEPNNTIGVRYSHGINSGKWELYSQDNAGAESVADLGVTVAVNTLYKIRIEVDKSRTEARAYINNVYAGRVIANLPNAVVCGSRSLHLKSAGTTPRVMYVHAMNAAANY